MQRCIQLSWYFTRFSAIKTGNKGHHVLAAIKVVLEGNVVATGGRGGPREATGAAGAAGGGQNSTL